MIELLTDNHFEKILDAFNSTTKEIKIISPFLTRSMAEKLCAVVEDNSISCSFITRFYLEDMISGANDIDALEMLMDSCVEVYVVKGLHTKLYLFDTNQAILGSANFTNGGFKSNIELSLLIRDENKLLEELQIYFDDMVEQLKSAKDGRITKFMIDGAREFYDKHIKRKKSADSGIVYSTKMYGATLDKKRKYTETDDLQEELERCKGENDLVHTLFKETEQVKQIYPFNIWLKFTGQGNNRIPANDMFPLATVTRNGHTMYLSTYPAPSRARPIKDGDEIYFAALISNEEGKNQIVIVGSGHLAGFTEENFASDYMIQQCSWMDRHPWYCIVTDCEIIDAPVKMGIPMDSVWNALGSDTYAASFGRNESIQEVSRKHYRKAHIRLSGNAKKYIDKKLEELKTQFGVIRYQSDVKCLHEN